MFTLFVPATIEAFFGGSDDPRFPVILWASQAALDPPGKAFLGGLDVSWFPVILWVSQALLDPSKPYFGFPDNLSHCQYSLLH